MKKPINRDVILDEYGGGIYTGITTSQQIDKLLKNLNKLFIVMIIIAIKSTSGLILFFTALIINNTKLLTLGFAIVIIHSLIYLSIMYIRNKWWVKLETLMKEEAKEGIKQ
ncbi:MAG: hypothetical protein ACTSQF_01980 [Candidatus Heimdallarchaeaceae archaeon]